MLVLLLLLGVLALGYLWLQRRYSYWSKRGVPGPKPTLLFGSIGPYLTIRKSLYDVYTDIYREHEGHPYVGFYRTVTPCFMPRDLELIRNITVKDFEHFQDNEWVIDRNADAIFGGNPFVLKGEEWKEKRAHVTHSFTTAKIKGMYEKLQQGAQRFVVYLNKQAANGNCTFETRQLSCMYTLDTVVQCAYGISSHLFEEPDERIIRMHKGLLSMNIFEMLKFALFVAIPNIRKYVSVRGVDKTGQELLIDLLRNAVEYRQKNGIEVKDFLGNVVTLNSKYGERDSLGLAASFFVDGSETTSLTMSLILFSIAADPKVQTKLRKEVEENFLKDGGDLSYETVQQMPYLEACFKEALRLYTLPYLPRICVKDYTYVPENSEYNAAPVKIEKGTPVIIPIAGIHKNPRYYQDPEKYNPDRFFNDEIVKYSFLPFGEGPRQCIGKRFGLVQVKTAIAYLVKNFELSVNKKTKLPLKLDVLSFLPYPEGGIHIDFKKI